MLNYRAAHTFLQLVRLLRVRRRIVRRYALLPVTQPTQPHEPEPTAQPDPPSDGEGVPEVAVVVETPAEAPPPNSAATAADGRRPVRQAAKDAMEVSPSPIYACQTVKHMRFSACVP